MDETAPLLPPTLHRTESKDDEPDIVDFERSPDSENPIDWPESYKWTIVGLLAFMAFTVTFTCIGVVPIAGRIVRDLNPDHHNDKSASVLLVTIWELGEAAGPLLIAPLSEIYGRYYVVNAANIGFILATALAVLSQTTPLFIAARALTGLAVMSNVLNPAIVGDIFESEQRGTAISTIMLAPMLGGAIGPAIAGAVAENIGWHAVIWGSVILASVCELLFLFVFRETYKVVILRRKASRLRKEIGNVQLRTVYDITDDKISDARKLLTSILRPFIVFFSSPVLIGISLYGAVSFTFFYIMSTSLPDILDNVYHLTPAQTGAAFIPFSVGSFSATLALNRSLDKVYTMLKKRSEDGIGQPEFRLPLVIAGSIGLPIMIVAYGWIPQLQLPLAIMLIALTLLGGVMLLAFLPVFAYVVDATGIYSASAMTAVIVTRCLIGTFLPLTTAPLIKQFGYGWAFTTLAGIVFALAPLPILLYRYGVKWRQGSKYTSGKDS